MTTKRSRGRPKGTTMNDARHLDAVADLIVCTPNLKKTPAIYKIVRKSFPDYKWQAAERRLLRKWNETACELLEAAQQRRVGHSKRVVRRTTPSEGSFPGMSSIVTDLVRAQSIFKDMQNTIDPLALRSMEEQMKAAKCMFDTFDPLTFQCMKEQMEMIRRVLGPLGLR